MARKNKIESSDHFDEIVKRLSEGETGASVSAWLENTYNEHISHTAINNYRKNKLNVPKEVAIEYKKKRDNEKKQEKKSSQKKKKMVNKFLGDLEILDVIINDSYDPGIDIKRLEHNPEVDQVQVENLKLKKRDQAIKGINAKTNILKNDDTNIEVNINNNFDDLFSEEDILRFIDESDFIEENTE